MERHRPAERQKTRFTREKRGGYTVPEGTFESALMVVKDVFSEQTLGVSDTSFWSQFEAKVTMEVPAACFQYYLAGVGHRTLAQNLLNHFENFRSAVQMGKISKEEAGQMVDSLASKLYEHYPPKYRNSISR